MDRVGSIAGILFVGLMLLSQQVTSQDSPESSSSISLSSGEAGPLLYCIFRGIPYHHEESWKIDDCTTCTCNNSTTTCVIKDCKPLSCHDIIKLEGECCFLCTYNLTVLEVRPSMRSRFDVSADGDATVFLAVEVLFKEEYWSPREASGEFLWELAAWILPVSSTNRTRFTQQILDVDQESQSYRFRKPFIFRDVVYSFSAPFLNCEEGDVCVELKRGSRARPTSGLPFSINGHPNETSLTGCTSLCSGPDVAPCVDSKGLHLHEDIWQRDPCTECTCDNGTAVCSTQRCPAPDCKRPVRLEGECCISCPYHVRVRRVSPLIISQGRIGKQEDQIHLRVSITFHESQHTSNVTGMHLWKLTAWTAHQSKSDKRYDFREQILDEDQRSQPYLKGRGLAFEGVEFRIVQPSVVACNSPFLICVRFDMDSDYQTEHDRGFELSGFPNNSSLIGCKSTMLPVEWCNNLDKTNSIANSNDTRSWMSCNSNGNIYAPGEEWKMSDCTTCYCGNSTITCHTERCKPTHCEAPIKHPGECCFICSSEPPAKTDLCIPLVISLIGLVFVVVVVQIIVFIHRCKKFKKAKDDDGMPLTTPQKGQTK